MYPNIFHTYLSESGMIVISVRSHENRADEFVFTVSDIEPSLDDDPSDDIWSGSEVFQLRRRSGQGDVKIYNGSNWIYWKVSRQDIEILNANLKILCNEAPTIEKDTTQLASVQPIVQSSSANYDDLLNQIRYIIQSEIQKGLQGIQTLEALPRKEKELSTTKLDSVTKPKDTFIPSNLSKGLEGEIRTSEHEESLDAALEAAKRLKEMKK